MATSKVTETDHLLADKILSTCNKIWNNESALHGNCSGFVRKIALNLGVNIEGDANRLCQKFTSKSDSSWHEATSYKHASELADKGFLVIAAKPEANRSGHVMIVVSGNTSDGYPRVFGGESLQSRSDGTVKCVRHCWVGCACKLVKYYYKRISLRY